MKICLVAIFLTLAALAYAKPTEKYTTKYDNVDLDEIIKSDRLLKNYVNCLLGKGNCTPDGAELKKVLPDALHSDCSKCSETQKRGSKKIVRHLIDHKKDWWKDLEAKYDPKGEYRKDYEEELNKEKKSNSKSEEKSDSKPKEKAEDKPEDKSDSKSEGKPKSKE